MAVMKMDFSEMDGREYKIKFQNGQNIAIITDVIELPKKGGREQLEFHFKNYFNEENTMKGWLDTDRDEARDTSLPEKKMKNWQTYLKIRRECLLKLLRATGVFDKDPNGMAEFDTKDLIGKVVGLRLMQNANKEGDGAKQYYNESKKTWYNEPPRLVDDSSAFFVVTEEIKSDHSLLKKEKPDWDKGGAAPKANAKVDHQAPLDDLDDEIPF